MYKNRQKLYYKIVMYRCLELRKTNTLNWGCHKVASSNMTCLVVHVFLQSDYTQYVFISKGPISKTGQISRFFKQWLVKFSKLSKNLFCSRFLSNPLVNVFNLSKRKLLLLHSNYHLFSCLDMLKLLCHSLDSAWLYNSQEFERNRFIFVFWANFD